MRGDANGRVDPMRLKVLNADETIAEIRRLYFETTKQTIGRDLERALHLLKSLPNEEARERAAVYMDGLAQMRAEWSARRRGRRKKPAGPGR
jgi:hypothetical protein